MFDDFRKYAYRWVCFDCLTMYEGATHTKMFGHRLCEDCGERMENVRCKMVKVRKLDFVWYKPNTWFSYSKMLLHKKD